jgi:hypothetical protein
MENMRHFYGFCSRNDNINHTMIHYSPQQNDIIEHKNLNLKRMMNIMVINLKAP